VASCDCSTDEVSSGTADTLTVSVSAGGSGTHSTNRAPGIADAAAGFSTQNVLPPTTGSPIVLNGEIAATAAADCNEIHAD
jgi:hypothetical protein